MAMDWDIWILLLGPLPCLLFPIASILISNVFFSRYLALVTSKYTYEDQS